MIDDESEPGSWQKAFKDRAPYIAAEQPAMIDDQAAQKVLNEQRSAYLAVAQPAMTDHAEAAALALEKMATLLRAGRPPEDLGADVVLIGRMMARKT